MIFQMQDIISFHTGTFINRRTLCTGIFLKMKNLHITVEAFHLAGAEGFEPSTKVLETHVLPLHHAPNRNGEIIRKQ